MHIRHLTGIGTKPPIRHCIPSWHVIHTDQEGRGEAWWDNAGIGIHQAIAYAERLDELINVKDLMGQELLLRDMHEEFNEAFIKEIIMKAERMMR